MKYYDLKKKKKINYLPDISLSVLVTHPCNVIMYCSLPTRQISEGKSNYIKAYNKLAV